MGSGAEGGGTGVALGCGGAGRRCWWRRLLVRRSGGGNAVRGVFWGEDLARKGQ